MALLVTPLTIPEIALTLFISEVHTRTIIRDMHHKKMIYIKSWTNEPVANQRGILRKQWAAGSRPDAERPRPIPAVVRSKREYEAIKADPERAAERKHKDHHRYLIRKFKANPDLFISWIIKKHAT